MGAIDFNADLGESFGLWQRGADDDLMRVISSANVACGFHAGDPATMRVAVETASRHGVAVGSHPGLPDRLGFGRRAMDVSASDVGDYVLYQTGALRAFARAADLRLHHVKPHGALYMMALDDAPLARAIAEAAARVDEGLPVYTLARSELWHAAEAAGVRPIPEFFADRPMRSSGEVVMFGWQEVFEATPESVAERVREFVTTGSVTSIEGDRVPVTAATICVHSDTPGADRIGPAVRAAIEAAGHELSSALPAGAAESRVGAAGT
jgi:5-oxoprolinase (ATP-hydrolysing) subunit A